MLMSNNGLPEVSLQATHEKNQTPSRAVLITGATALLPVAILAARGAGGLDVYGWMGSLATYGFIMAYALVSIALPRYLRNHGVGRPGARIISLVAWFAMVAAAAGDLFSVSGRPYWRPPP